MNMRSSDLDMMPKTQWLTCFSECEGKHVVGASIFGEKINFEGECDLDSVFEAKFSHSPLTYSYTPLIDNLVFKS
ncbi:hypothetical protein VNO80_26754 [Phaseolus coccineus]|uniref:Uncharacterized protein n=1 Tax=Phaseolus coccineus TaxID=3886 RepID=A0AAN9QER6_PHACN